MRGRGESALATATTAATEGLSRVLEARKLIYP